MTEKKKIQIKVHVDPREAEALVTGLANRVNRSRRELKEDAAMLRDLWAQTGLKSLEIMAHMQHVSRECAKDSTALLEQIDAAFAKWGE
jgi:hypothetical protein